MGLNMLAYVKNGNEHEFADSKYFDNIFINDEEYGKLFLYDEDFGIRLSMPIRIILTNAKIINLREQEYYTFEARILKHNVDKLDNLKGYLMTTDNGLDKETKEYITALQQFFHTCRLKNFIVGIG